MGYIILHAYNHIFNSDATSMCCGHML
jgi:hypothetical protein